MNYFNLYNFKNKKNKAVHYIAFFFILSFNALNANILTNINESCIWAKSDAITDSTKIDSLLSFSEKNNIDKIFFQIRSRGDAFYESQLVPKSNAVDSLFDPLNYAIENAKEIDVEIHAWFNTYILWSDIIPPTDSLHFYYSCTECFATDINGKSDRDIRLNQHHSYNWEGVYLSPLHPHVNEYLLLVVDELIKTYNLDGIHFDYIRYQDIFYGYNSTGIDIFENKHGFNPKDLNRGVISTRFGYKEDEVDSLTNLWDQYKLDSITNFLISVKNLIINDGYTLEMSVAAKPDILEAKYRWYQDWIYWINENIIDYAVIMNYEKNINKFNLYNKLIKNRLTFEKMKKINIGISMFNQDAISVSDKILLSRLNGFENYSLFSYDVGKDTLGWYKPVVKVLNFNLK